MKYNALFLSNLLVLTSFSSEDQGGVGISKFFNQVKK